MSLSKEGWRGVLVWKPGIDIVGMRGIALLSSYGVRNTLDVCDF
jgi:hypothetical protein